MMEDKSTREEKRPESGTTLTPLIGDSPALRQVLEFADSVASSNCTVLINGETGTGKELVARRIHEKSTRNYGSFIPVNCPAVTESLFESQFFGHVRGSFTGAEGDTLGMVRAAEGGTLFLDEIGELPLHMQPKILRLLQEKEITPVGSPKSVNVDVRFIAATNKPLQEAVSERVFRSDLYHRLNIASIEIPPLRCRKEDIQLLLDHYLEYFADEYGTATIEPGDRIREGLNEYHWPGNVRELCCWVERIYATGMPPAVPGSGTVSIRSSSPASIAGRSLAERAA